MERRKYIHEERKQTGMEQILKAVEEIGTRLDKMEERNKEAEKRREEELCFLREEIRWLKEEINKDRERREKKWEVEKSVLRKEIEALKSQGTAKKNEREVEDLRSRMKKIEENEENKERRERRNNLIVSEKTADGGKMETRQVEEKAKNIVKDLLGREPLIIGVKCISKDRGRIVSRVALKSLEEKKLILARKGSLRGTQIYVEDDLTKKEVEIQKKLRLLAIEERNKGKHARVGYKKVCIDGKWIKWEDIEVSRARQEDNGA